MCPAGCFCIRLHTDVGWQVIGSEESQGDWETDISHRQQLPRNGAVFPIGHPIIVPSERHTLVRHTCIHINMNLITGKLWQCLQSWCWFPYSSYILLWQRGTGRQWGPSEPLAGTASGRESGLLRTESNLPMIFFHTSCKLLVNTCTIDMRTFYISKFLFAHLHLCFYHL